MGNSNTKLFQPYLSLSLLCVETLLNPRESWMWWLSESSMTSMFTPQFPSTKREVQSNVQKLLFSLSLMSLLLLALVSGFFQRREIFLEEFFFFTTLGHFKPLLPGSCGCWTLNWIWTSALQVAQRSCRKGHMAVKGKSFAMLNYLRVEIPNSDKCGFRDARLWNNL